MTSAESVENGGTSVPEAPQTPQATSRRLGEGWLVGGLCDDPLLKYTATGKSLCKLRIAVSQRRRDEDTGQWVQGETQYVDVACWGKQAERVTDSLRKGDRVMAVGTWNEESWTGKDGQRRERRTMTATEVGPSLLFKPVRVLRQKDGSEG